jgi:acyl-CoA synthetase (AMP-forming)/AMP-acid ligase II
VVPFCRQQEDGYGIFISRKDDLIIRGGYNIDPREIEEALYTHPLIKQVMVVGMPDERLGERISAFIIPKDGQNNLSLKDITQFLETKGIGKNHWPEAIKITDSFPMTSDLLFASERKK